MKEDKLTKMTGYTIKVCPDADDSWRKRKIVNHGIKAENIKIC